MIIKHSDELDQVFGALSKAQGEIENVAKTKENPFFKSNYADLATVLLTVRPVFAKHDLCIVQMPTSSDAGEIELATMIGHKSGQYIMSSLPCKPAKNDAQAIGSVITYLRRYAAASMAGIAQEDDDGNAGSMEPSGGKKSNNQTKNTARQEDKPKRRDMAVKADSPQDYAQKVCAMIGKATADELQWINQDNAGPLDNLQTQFPDLWAKIEQAVIDRKAALRE